MKFIIPVLLAVCFAGPVEASTGYRDAIKVDRGEIAITIQARDHIVDAGLVTILYQAASAPVFDTDGDQVGYMLTDIDAGSIYDTIGLQNGDIVTHIDGDRLSDPKRAVDLLRWAKEQEEFTFSFRRQEQSYTYRVRVTNTDARSR